MTHANDTSLTFVLVHGAWHGGWCWERVATPLRQMGHRVFTPTLTGLGERSHLLTPDVDLHTFVRDVCNLIQWERLHDVVLVGHSFAGLVISGVADAMPDRIRQLVYLDAFILESGVSTFDTLPAAIVDKLRQAAMASGEVPALPSPKPASLGLAQPEDVEFVQDRLTPHPLRSYETALNLTKPLGAGLPACYIHCTEPSFPAVDGSRQWVRQRTDWTWQTLACGHDAMVSAPELVVEALMHATVLSPARHAGVS